MARLNRTRSDKNVNESSSADVIQWKCKSIDLVIGRSYASNVRRLRRSANPSAKPTLRFGTLTDAPPGWLLAPARWFNSLSGPYSGPIHGVATAYTEQLYLFGEVADSETYRPDGIIIDWGWFPTCEVINNGARIVFRSVGFHVYLFMTDENPLSSWRSFLVERCAIRDRPDQDS